MAAEALGRTGELYAVEEAIAGRAPEDRREVRQACSRPRVEALKAWLEATLPTLSRRSDLARAMRYALSRWPALIRYLDDGRLAIGNNPAERAANCRARAQELPLRRPRSRQRAGRGDLLAHRDRQAQRALNAPNQRGLLAPSFREASRKSR